MISNSWGGSGSAQLITDAVNYAYSKGCVIVAAAGNLNIDVAGFYPANMTNVIAVAAFDQNDQKCSFSNWGTKIDVAAPGGNGSSNPYNILSLLSSNHAGVFNTYIVGGSYLRLGGTSMACPHVSAVAALVLAIHPDFNAEQVRYVLRNSTDDVDSSGWDIKSGYGRINAYKALQITNASKATAVITSPVSGTTVKGTINIEGIATGVSYKLEYTKAVEPYVYTLIGSGLIVNNRVSAAWNTASIREVEDGEYILKLTVIDANNLAVETRNIIILDNKNLFISSPLNNDVLRAGDKIEIRGNVKGMGFQSYTVEYSQDKKNWSVINQGNLAVDNGLLVVWDTSLLLHL